MIDRVASWMRAAERIVILTGAGISAESGVPVFRGEGGLWRRYRPEQLATPEAFARQPELVWDWYTWRRARIASAQPNAGHVTIARWQQTRGARLLTQNVDGLHARAGGEAIELHGNLWRVKCTAGCGVIATDRVDAPPRTVLRCACGAWLRPDVVWFGEVLDAEAMEEAAAAVAEADVVLVVGTSAMVYPVAALPQLARRQVPVIEINTDATALEGNVTARLRGRAGDVLPALEQAL